MELKKGSIVSIAAGTLVGYQVLIRVIAVMKIDVIAEESAPHPAMTEVAMEQRLTERHHQVGCQRRDAVWKQIDRR